MAFTLFYVFSPDVFWEEFVISIDTDKQSPRKLAMRVFIVDDSKVVAERLADRLNEVPGAQPAGQAHDVAQEQLHFLDSALQS